MTGNDALTLTCTACGDRSAGFAAAALHQADTGHADYVAASDANR